MKTNTLNAEEAAAILFGDQFDYAGFNPSTASFASGADVCEWLAAHFGFTDADYRALHVERLVRTLPTIEDLREVSGYDPDEDTGVDSLIDYKDAIEDAYGSVLSSLRKGENKP